MAGTYFGVGKQVAMDPPSNGAEAGAGRAWSHSEVEAGHSESKAEAALLLSAASPMFEPRASPPARAARIQLPQ